MDNKVIEINRVYNVQEAADLLGLHPETIKEYCRLGTIKCKKIGEWKILGQNLIEFMQPTNNLTMEDGSSPLKE